MTDNTFGCRVEFDSATGSKQLYSLESLEQKIGGNISRLPVSMKILLEQALRNHDEFQVLEEHVRMLAHWDGSKSDKEIPHKPTRVLLQDFTGVPAVVDLASLRSAMAEMGGDPEVINPRVPVDLVIDHSVQVDHSGSADALEKNMAIEFERNRERYEFLKWGQSAFQQFRAFPPGVGIVHQVNLEHIASVVQEHDGVCFPDTVVGTDSHTTMINGLGVMGWGVGGIEAESVMLGQPIYMLMPQVVGFRLIGELPAGATATDLVLRVVELLRQKGVVEKFVEFFGPGLSNLKLADRATLANMGPEYGATMGFFPVDSETLNYLRNTGRPESIVQRVEAYCKAQGLFRTDGMADPVFSDTLELDLSTVEPALAGPKRPQDRVNLSAMQPTWQQTLRAPINERGFELNEEATRTAIPVQGLDGQTLSHGDVTIAAITSCTNTSNPSVMIAAGLLAKKANERGLRSKPWVKTSLGPGSRVVTEYLNRSGLSEHLDALDFQTVGYGCTTCIGNSGPLPEHIVQAINEGDLVVTSVLSGNRNFEGRISPNIKANYLASPPLVVAYALAGTVNCDLQNDALGKDHDGNDVFLKQIWPSQEEVAEVEALITSDLYQKAYGRVDEMTPMWNEIKAKPGQVYGWEEASTYIQNPPFFTDMGTEVSSIQDIVGARMLLKLGDSVTTDHISPAGSFKADTPAGRFLTEKGVAPQDFNSFGSRRGNDRVMTRGTFANVRIRNQIAPGTEGGFTTHFPTGEVTSVYEAAMRYRESGTPLVVLGGSEYGTGSSRDWAAKGTFLLGVKAVVVASFERIHRSNLVGMGVLPLQFLNGETHESLGLAGSETLSVLGLGNDLLPQQQLILKADDREIPVLCRLDNKVEIEYYRNGGILHTVLRNFMREA
ncbi:MAG: aconitate hydratase AcnA [Deltaproteobacteria bacterium]|jgi:aconitate hydratase|nr:aconitate hydratase AcnA [Deltaproteobacteria bacterium]MDP7629010.1 aconitate hydratase AcnA [SAR324 cluster bacterium]